MSDSLVMVLAVVGTCVFIFAFSLLLAPVIKNMRRSRGLDDVPEPPMSKQARTIAIICVGAAAATLLMAFAEGNAALYVAAGAVFVLMLVVVVVLSVRDGRQAREGHRDRHPAGLGSS
jgi:4-hydroxybenzoate polyprenyltransferase